MILYSPEYIMNKFKSLFEKKEYNNFILIFITGIIVNLGQFIYQGGEGDTNVYTIYQPNYDWECMLGRWMIQYVGRLRNHVVSPILIEICAIAIFSATLILIFNLLNINKKAFIFIGACLFFSQPFVSFLLHIYYCADAYALSALFAVMAAWILLKLNSIYKYVFSVICMVISLSLYQSCIVLTGILVLVDLLKEYLNTDNNFKSCLKKNVCFFFVGIAGIIFYILTVNIYLNMHGLALADYKGMDTMGQINIPRSIYNLKSLLKTMYLDSTNDIIGYSRWINGKLGIVINIFIILIGFLWLLKTVIHNRRQMNTPRLAIIAACTIILPGMWGVIVFMAPQASIHPLLTPHQTLLYLYALSAFESTGHIEHVICQLGRWIGITSILYITFNYYLVGSEYQYGLKLADNKAYSMALEINDSLRRMPCQEGSTKIAIIGKTDFHNLIPTYYQLKGSNETLFWDGYSSQLCWQKYLLERTGIYYTICDQDTYNSLINSEQVKEMAAFPKENSVRLIDDTIVVKLGEEGQ